jgi:hypothetical protein
MSRGPTKEGAAEFIRLSRRMGEVKAELPKLEAAAQEATTRWRKTGEEIKRCTDDLRRQLDQMDCASRGNTGFAERVAELLGEVVRQIDAERPGDIRNPALVNHRGDCSGGRMIRMCESCLELERRASDKRAGVVDTKLSLLADVVRDQYCEQETVGDRGTAPTEGCSCVVCIAREHWQAQRRVAAS